jgi:hypothetical protein
LNGLLGRHPDQLSLSERHALAGKWIAVELYSPATLPLKKIEAVGDTARACAHDIEARGLDPSKYEYIQMSAPYQS